MAGKNEIREILEGLDTGKILYDEPMSRHTSLAVGGRADAVIFIEREEELVRVVRRLNEKKKDYFIAGNLTNVIVRDGGYRGAILMMTGMKKVDCRHDAKGGVIFAEAGAPLAKVVNVSAAEELSGFEFCAGIPGSIGGAVWMNAGAYGREMKDVVEEVTILNSDKEKKTLKASEISFSYRKTLFPSGAVVLGALFRMEKGERFRIRERINEIMQSRQAKHPLEFPSAGSVFKNLPGQPAGRLIEEMGMKGLSAGGAQISPKHANFIVNKGGASASDILKLIDMVQSKARDEKGVRLETEVVIIGEN